MLWKNLKEAGLKLKAGMNREGENILSGKGREGGGERERERKREREREKERESVSGSILQFPCLESSTTT